MSILALELSSAVGSIAWRAQEETIVRQFPADRQHSGLFFQNLAELRDLVGLPEKIVVGLGPGSYAGTRIAIATALGLRAANGAQLVGLPSICAIDLPAYGIVGDARRGSYFFAEVRAGSCVEGPTLVSEAELRMRLEERPELPMVAAAPLPAFPSLPVASPSAALLAALGEDAVMTEENLEPLYLRQPYITTPKATPWSR